MDNIFSWLWLLMVPMFLCIFWFSKKVKIEKREKDSTKVFIALDVYLVYDRRKQLYRKYKIKAGEDDKQVGWENKDFVKKMSRKWENH